jgi:hypothetical protein
MRRGIYDDGQQPILQRVVPEDVRKGRADDRAFKDLSPVPFPIREGELVFLIRAGY